MNILLEHKLQPKNREQILAYLRIEEEDAEKISWCDAFQYANKFHNPLAKKLAQALNT